MSCADYLTKVRAFATGLEDSDHPNIQPPDDDGSGGPEPVQTDHGGMNLTDLKNFVAPGRNRDLGPIQTGGDPATVYTAYRQQSSDWLEQWVVRGEGSLDDEKSWKLWTKVSSSILDEHEKAALQSEPGSGLYKLADMSFTYKLMNRDALPPAPAAQGCAATRSLFHLWNVVGGRVGVGPVGALFRERYDDGGQHQYIDHWILRENYQPPRGTTEVLFEPKTGGVPGHLKGFLQAYVFPVPPPAPGADGPIGPYDLVEAGRYVLCTYTPEPLF